MSEAEAIAAAGILATVDLALLGYIGRRLYNVGQRKSLLSHLGLEIVSNHRKLDQLVGYPLSRAAWADHRVRGLFASEDGIAIEAAYVLGDAYNTHIERRVVASGEQIGAEDRAIRETAQRAASLFASAGKIVEKYGWPK